MQTSLLWNHLKVLFSNCNNLCSKSSPSWRQLSVAEVLLSAGGSYKPSWCLCCANLHTWLSTLGSHVNTISVGITVTDVFTMPTMSLLELSKFPLMSRCQSENSVPQKQEGIYSSLQSDVEDGKHYNSCLQIQKQHTSICQFSICGMSS